MNRELIGNLIALRYKLMWAKTRSRNGRIALFVIGYLLLIAFAGVMAAGGIGAGIGAVKSGHALAVAQGVLLSIYMGAILWTLLLGFGMNTIFSETELRRYPIDAAGRRFVKFFIGILDPYWVLFLLCDLGLVVGIYVFGNASLGIGVLAVLLLIASNYALARTLGIVIDRLAETPAGSAAMLILIMGVSMLPSLLASVMRRNPVLLDRVLAVLRYSPPFAAADAITAPGARGYYGLLLTAWWLAVFVAALIWVDKHPFQSRAVRAKAADWDSRYERVGAWFGASNAAMVGFWLRFYFRNNRVRTLYFMGLPLGAFLAFAVGQNKGTGVHDWFIGSLGAIPVVGTMGVSRIAVNQFGYAGGGFRRFFLLPTDPGATLRAASYAALVMSAALLPLGLIAYAILAPGGRDPRQLFMLACSGVAGVLLFNGMGLWSTLYGPRKGNYNSAVGNDLSFVGNVVVIGCILGCMFTPVVLKKLAPELVSPANWPWAVLPVGATYAFYKISLSIAAPLMHRRREALMAVLEGKA